jgi:hypothetical protein
MAASMSSGSTAFATPLKASQAAIQQQADKNVEATLAEYAPFMVNDNWLDEELVDMMLTEEMGLEEEVDVEEQNRMLDEQFAQMEAGGVGAKEEEDLSWMQSDEPWDLWGQPRDVDHEETIRVEPNPGM